MSEPGTEAARPRSANAKTLIERVPGPPGCHAASRSSSDTESVVPSRRPAGLVLSFAVAASTRIARGRSAASAIAAANTRRGRFTNPLTHLDAADATTGAVRSARTTLDHRKRTLGPVHEVILRARTEPSMLHKRLTATSAVLAAALIQTPAAARGISTLARTIRLGLDPYVACASSGQAPRFARDDKRELSHQRRNTTVQLEQRVHLGITQRARVNAELIE
jgi:hypothetical protein